MRFEMDENGNPQNDDEGQVTFGDERSYAAKNKDSGCSRKSKEGK